MTDRSWVIFRGFPRIDVCCSDVDKPKENVFGTRIETPNGKNATILAKRVAPLTEYALTSRSFYTRSRYFASLVLDLLRFAATISTCSQLLLSASRHATTVKTMLGPRV